ncbi:MAG TPA: AraC family transcriptional regulator [Usitatibacter sp.]|nr:AraC family transcriptional regulator [Usitatibacter sp.]
MERIEHRQSPGAGLRAYQLQQVLDIIDARLAEPIQVAELAAAAHLSPFHFSRMFKKSTGHAPHAYITTRRMELARRLLASNDFSLAEIATRVGYQTQAHFTDVFRKHVGATPGAYRRNGRERLRSSALHAVAQVSNVAPTAPSSPSPETLQPANP